MSFLVQDNTVDDEGVTDVITIGYNLKNLTTKKNEHKQQLSKYQIENR